MKKEEENNIEKRLGSVISGLTKIIVFLLFVIVALFYVIIKGVPDFGFKAPVREFSAEKNIPEKNPLTIADLWKAPDTSTIPHTEQGMMIRYGRELVANTAYYLGPKGKAGQHYS